MSMEVALQSEGAETALMMDGKRPTPIVRDAHALLVRGIEALERSHIEEAVGLLRQSVEIDGTSFFAQLALGVALTRALEIPEAEQALEKAIQLDPRNFWGHVRMAELFQRVGVPTRSQEELRIALDFAETSEERKIARDLLEADQRHNPKRAWRPDFTRLLSGRRKRPR
jgi:tetratricopeptide (TPR) repeat protein